jgi:hypothetical protein
MKTFKLGDKINVKIGKSDETSVVEPGTVVEIYPGKPFYYLIKLANFKYMRTWADADVMEFDFDFKVGNRVKLDPEYYSGNNVGTILGIREGDFIVRLDNAAFPLIFFRDELKPLEE